MRCIEISEADAGQRLDRYLRKYLPSAPLASIYKLARTGKIKIDGKRVNNEHRVEAGETLSMYLTEEQFGQYQIVVYLPPVSRKTELNFLDWILYEDEYILAINKPSKINVHPGDHKTTEMSIIQLAQDYFGEKYTTPMFTPSLVHRIDRDTTGILLIAKDRHSLNYLLDELQAHTIEKKYLALVVGKTDTKGTIDIPLLRIENAQNASKVRTDPSGKKAVTHYRSLGNSGELSLIEVQLETGRMHQIRVHMAYLKHPILFDLAYGDTKINREFQRNTVNTRQMLHAHELTFTHPHTKEKLTLQAPIPEDMQKIIETYLPGLSALSAL